MQGQQRLIGQRDDFAAPADARAQVLDVGFLAGAVDDQQQVVLAVGEHEVVENAALLIEQQAVALAVGREALHVHRYQRLQRVSGCGAAQQQLAHVGDVEQACRAACVRMLGHQARGILDGQGVARERDHARAELVVQIE